MIVVTGAAGFIGSNIIKGLNQRGREDILAVGNLEDGTKFKNLVDLNILDFMDMDDFIENLDDLGESIDVIFHQGACSSTTEWDGRYLMDVNYQYSKTLLNFCIDNNVQFIYASSAAVYGSSSQFTPIPENEKPLNLYGYTKILFDRFVRRVINEVNSQIVGLRYFNVYGPREDHKKDMVSVIRHFHNQIIEKGHIEIFTGFNQCQAGEQKRDFVYVEDVVNVNLWCYDNPTVKGIYNCGSGQATSFNDIAKAVIAFYGKGEIQYVPAPEILRGRYQIFTKADMSALKKAGYDQNFHDIVSGVKAYLTQL